MKRRTRALSLFVAVLFWVSALYVSTGALEPYGNNVRIRNWVRNDPSYQFSGAYQTSVWYQNFSDLTLTENHRNNVLRIALSQLGYHEGNSKEDFSGTNRSGRNNYVEYARLVVPTYNDNHYEWCACFVNWCLSQARVDYAYGEISCWKWASWFQERGQWKDSPAYGGSARPLPADIIYFNKNLDNYNSSHTGLVLYTTETQVYTIEGNTSDQCVALRSYALDDPFIIGYGTPAYHTGSEKTLSLDVSGGIVSGWYIAYRPSFDAMTFTPHNQNGARPSIPSGAMVYVHEQQGDRTLVCYQGLWGVLHGVQLALLDPTASAPSMPPDETDSETFPETGTENPPTDTESVVGADSEFSNSESTTESGKPASGTMNDAQTPANENDESSTLLIAGGCRGQLPSTLAFGAILCVLVSVGVNRAGSRGHKRSRS